MQTSTKLSKDEILAHLKLVSWDIPFSKEQLYSLMIGEVSTIQGFTRHQLYAKIVNSFNWHKVRKMIPDYRLKEALSDQVLISLFPRSLREKYKNVRGLL